MKCQANLRSVVHQLRSYRPIFTACQVSSSLVGPFEVLVKILVRLELNGLWFSH